jgi:ABC-2 type transport system ATP-binding protein
MAAFHASETPLRSETALAIDAQGLTKHFGDIRAVEDLNLEIPGGRFFGLLGPNGSGKTTTIHMLTTLVRPTRGRATVAGHDVAAEPVAVRRDIGLVFQESAVDRNLTVAENLNFAGALYKLPSSIVRRRTSELLDLFDLDARRDTVVANLSGGMRRAVDIARGVLHRPRILFLDEPTVGLDIINRNTVWRFIERLRKEESVTVLFTTHYLEEAADCDEVAFLAMGRIVGRGAPHELTRALAAYILEVESADLDGVADHLRPRFGRCLRTGKRARLRVRDEHFSLADLQAELDSRVSAVQIRHPDLNDVYLWLNSPEESR